MVTATVNPMLMNTGSQYFWTDILNVVQRTCGVQCHISAYGVMVTGSLSQVTRAGGILQIRWREFCSGFHQGGRSFYQADGSFNQSNTNHDTNFNQSNTFVNQFDMNWNQGVPNFNNPGTNVNQFGTNLNQSGLNANQYDTSFNQRDMHFNQRDTQFNQRDTQSNQIGTNSNTFGTNSINSSFGRGRFASSEAGFSTMGYHNQPPVTKQPGFLGTNQDPQQFPGNYPNIPGYIARSPRADVIQQRGNEQPRSIDRNFPQFENNGSMNDSLNSNVMGRNRGSGQGNADPLYVEPGTSADSLGYSQPRGNPFLPQEPRNVNKSPNSNIIEGDQDLISLSKREPYHVEEDTSTDGERWPGGNPFTQQQPGHVDEKVSSNTTVELGTDPLKAETTTSATPFELFEKPSSQQQPGHVDKSSNTTGTDQFSGSRTDSPKDETATSPTPSKSFQNPQFQQQPGSFDESRNSNTMERGERSGSTTNSPKDEPATSPDSKKTSQPLDQEKIGTSMDTTTVTENTAPTTFPPGEKESSLHGTTGNHQNIASKPSTGPGSSTVSTFVPTSDDRRSEKLPSSPGSPPGSNPPVSKPETLTPNHSPDKQRISTISGSQVESPSNETADSESERPPISSDSTIDNPTNQDSTINSEPATENSTSFSNPLAPQSNEKPEFPEEKTPSLPETSTNSRPQGDDEQDTTKYPITSQRESTTPNNNDESPLHDQLDADTKNTPADSTTTLEALSNDQASTTQHSTIGLLNSATSDDQIGTTSTNTSDVPSGEPPESTENIPSDKQQQQNTPDQISNENDQPSFSKNQTPEDTVEPEVEPTTNPDSKAKTRTPVPLPRQRRTPPGRQNAANFLSPAKQPGQSSPTSAEPDNNSLNGKSAPVIEPQDLEEDDQSASTQVAKTVKTTEERKEMIDDELD